MRLWMKSKFLRINKKIIICQKIILNIWNKELLNSNKNKAKIKTIQSTNLQAKPKFYSTNPNKTQKVPTPTKSSQQSRS